MSLTLASEQRRSYTAPLVIAALASLVVMGALFYFNPHREGELRATHTVLYAPQATFNTPKGSLHVIGAHPHVEQEFYAVVTVQIENDLRLPMFINEVDGKYVGADSGEVDCVSPGPADLARVQEIFPQLKAMMPHPILMGDTVPPKGLLEGQVLLQLSGVSDTAWKTRKPSTVTVHFRHQNPMTVTVP